jgi:hypothetical protein
MYMERSLDLDFTYSLPIGLSSLTHFTLEVAFVLVLAGPIPSDPRATTTIDFVWVSHGLHLASSSFV